MAQHKNRIKKIDFKLGVIYKTPILYEGIVDIVSSNILSNFLNIILCRKYVPRVAICINCIL